MASEACCTPAPPAEHADVGKVESIGGLDVYVNNPTSSEVALILACDVFGYEAPLLRKLADKTAASGFYAVVPDYFRGEPYKPTDLANPWAEFPPWITKHHPDASIDDTLALIKALKAQGVEKIGIAGFCWGARVCAMVGKEPDVVQAIVMLHPSLTTVENIKELTVPTAILGSELDDFTPPSLVMEFKEILATKPFPSMVKIFPGQTHGWSIRYDVKSEHEVKGAEEAHGDMLQFFKSVLL